MNQKGFSLIIVIILSLALSLISATGLYIATLSNKSTEADTKLNLAEKAANAGIMDATDYVNRIGFCSNYSRSNVQFGNASYSYDITRSGRICFIRSTGNIAQARVVKTSIIQSYYGVGLYTVRGNVSATLGGSGVRLSGCDRSINPTCFMPAFIASGTVNLNINTSSCDEDQGGSGIYGRPAILPNIAFDDLIPLFFNVNCFNRRSPGSSCVSFSDKSLLEVFEDEFASINPLTLRKEFNFDNQEGIPIIDNNIIIQAQQRENSIGSQCTYTSATLNLSSNLTNCSEIRLESAVTTITGTRNNSPVTIYAFRGTSQLTFRDTGTNPQWVTLYTNRPLSLRVNSNATTNFTVYTTNTVTISNTIGVGDNNNPSTISFKIVSTNTITLSSGTTLLNGIIVNAPTDVNDTNNAAAPQYIQVNGTFTMDDIALFTERLNFSSNITVNIWNSLVFVYAYACPNCSRSTNTSSLNACDSDSRRCGWYGQGVSLNLGRDPNATDQEKPVIFVSNNTTVRTDSPKSASIWGAWVGEDVTYLRWSGSSITQDFRGFLVRNFPRNLTLTINITSNFSMSFRKSILDKLSNKYWWFRKIDCVLDDLTPATQLIQTRMTAY
ncbi:MAG: hypothetical protein QXS54_08560 [Candidatus Methanomethylicaceae archaeon]